jgi:hypothetical protein
MRFQLVTATVLFVVLSLGPGCQISRPDKKTSGVPESATGIPDARQQYVTTRLEHDASGSTWLTFTLSNYTDSDWVIYTYDLPWSRPSLSLCVAAAKGPTSSPLTELFAIDDPGPKRITLKRHRTLEGNLRIDGRFFEGPRRPIEFFKKPAPIEYLFFWSFQLRTVERTKFKRCSGVLSSSDAVIRTSQ